MLRPADGATVLRTNRCSERASEKQANGMVVCRGKCCPPARWQEVACRHGMISHAIPPPNAADRAGPRAAGVGLGIGDRFRGIWFPERCMESAYQLESAAGATVRNYPGLCIECFDKRATGDQSRLAGARCGFDVGRWMVPCEVTAIRAALASKRDHSTKTD
jgi:hypothetical protein